MVLIVFRARGDNWNQFKETVQAHRDELKGLGARAIYIYKNRSHPEEWMMIQEWTEKARFDDFAASRGPEWDRQAGVKWTDVSTWEETEL